MLNETMNTMVAVNAEEIKEEIVDNMESVLDRYDWEYTRRALNKIYDTFLERKANLIDILSKHPKWNPEKMYIHFDADYTRSFDGEEFEKFVSYISQTIAGMTAEERENLYDKVEEEFPCIVDTANYYYISRMGTIMRFFDILENNLESSKLTKEMEKQINEYYPELKCKEGQKISRLIGKYCTKLGLNKCQEYERRYAKVADSLSPITYKRHTVLSVNPVDFLMMSNGNTWASCHTIDIENTEGRSNDYEGCYCAGTLSYMLDECSMVFYTVDSEADGNDMELEHKVLRNMFHYQNNKLLQARLYPQCNDSNSSNELKANIRAIVQKIFADCLGINNLWKTTKKYNGMIKTGDGACNYPDYFHFTCHMSYPKSMETLENTGDRMVIGARPMCIECGDEYCIFDNNTINGCSGRPNEDIVYCEDCGARIDREDAYYYDGGYYCEDCTVWSEIQQEQIPSRESVEVITDSYCNDYVTYFYAKHSDEIGKCDGCGEYYYEPDTEGTGYCHDCERDMESCKNCGCLIIEGCEEYHEGNVYCRDCFEEILEKEKEEEENEVPICEECGCVIEDGVHFYNGKQVCSFCFGRLIETDIEDEIELPLGVYENEIA